MLLIATLPACSQQADSSADLRVSLEFVPPPHVGEVTCHISMVSLDGEPISGANLEVEANMNHAGMVPVFGEGTEVEEGLYDVPLRFTMGGDWFLIVRGETSEGASFESFHDLPGIPVELPASDGRP